MWFVSKNNLISAAQRYYLLYIFVTASKKGLSTPFSFVKIRLSGFCLKGFQKWSPFSYKQFQNVFINSFNH